MYGFVLLRIVKLSLLIGLFLTGVLGAQAQQAGQKDFSGARLRALNKLTAELVIIDTVVDSQAEFGSLTIVVRACRKPVNEEEDDSVAFLEIHDRAEENKRVFMGWMFASSPSLSALEHPLYDVWVEKCNTS